jgi:hypothetical protein
MSFYNRRLVALAKRRHATGHFAAANSGWRELYDGFVPDARVRKLIQKGLFRWWKAELMNVRLMFARNPRRAALSTMHKTAEDSALAPEPARAAHTVSS